MFTVTTAATDMSLLTAAELRGAVGAVDNSKDTELAAIGLAVAVAIARACGVAESGVDIPTLKTERITETWRLSSEKKCLLTARRFVSSITSITVDGVALLSTEYEVDRAAGIIYRLDETDCRICWAAGKIIAVYDAGLSSVPPDLKMAAKKMVADIYASDTRDPNLKRLKIDGVSEREWWVGPATDPAITREILDLLTPYRTVRL